MTSKCPMAALEVSEEEGELSCIQKAAKAEPHAKHRQQLAANAIHKLHMIASYISRIPTFSGMYKSEVLGLLLFQPEAYQQAPEYRQTNPGVIRRAASGLVASAALEIARLRSSDLEDIYHSGAQAPG